MIHHASPEFWEAYRALPAGVRAHADRAFALLKSDPKHPSLRFKRVGDYYSARIGLHHRAVAISVPGGVAWFWIGTHAEYDRLLG